MEVIIGKQCMVRRRPRPDGPLGGCPVIYVDSQKEGSVPVLCNGVVSQAIGAVEPERKGSGLRD